MSEVRKTYRVNHSDIRAFGKLCRDPQARRKAIAAACKDRKFWKGGNWSQPASTGAIAALRTLEREPSDILFANVCVNKSLSAGHPGYKESMRIWHQCLLGALKLQSKPLLP